MVIIHTQIKNKEGVNVFFKINEHIELYINLKDTIIIDILINSENMYSAFPWPKL